MPGRHNVSNALAAAVAAGGSGSILRRPRRRSRRIPGAPPPRAAREQLDIAVYDDYAHHPTEIRAIFSAARELVPGRLVCIFQPHTYSRLNQLFDDFATCFDDADVALITEVYAPAGRGPSSGDRNSEDLVRTMTHHGARYTGDLRASLDALVATVRPGDLVITMGAGDITNLAASYWQTSGAAVAEPVSSRPTHLDKQFGERLKLNERLADQTSFRIGGAADYFVLARSRDDIVNAISAAEKDGVPWLVLGRGSNVLVRDNGVRGLSSEIMRLDSRSTPRLAES